MRHDEKQLTLLRFPGPVLIIVYKLSPELFESGRSSITDGINGGGGQEIGRGSIQESTNLQGWAWWEFLGVLRLQKHPDTHQEKISVLKWCLHGFKLIASVHDRRAAKLGSHPVCTRRGWRIRHLKPKTHIRAVQIPFTLQNVLILSS